MLFMTSAPIRVTCHAAASAKADPQLDLTFQGQKAAAFTGPTPNSECFCEQAAQRPTPNAQRPTRLRPWTGSAVASAQCGQAEGRRWSVILE